MKNISIRHGIIAVYSLMLLGCSEDFLEKPVDLKELLAKIDEAQNKRILILQKQSKDEIKDILKRKGW